MGKRDWFSHGSSRSAGVAVLLGNFKGHILNYEVDDEGRWIILLVDISQTKFVPINTYATITSEFYKAFSEELPPFLLSQGVITLIPKTNKRQATY